MCGGSVEIVPCSRVGHIFRSFSPYKWRTDLQIPEYNYKRVASVWMDEFRHLYYDRLGQTGAEESHNIGQFGDISQRHGLGKHKNGFKNMRFLNISNQSLI